MKADRTLIIMAAAACVFMIALAVIFLKPSPAVPAQPAAITPVPTTVQAVKNTNKLPDVAYKTENLAVRLPATWIVKRYQVDNGEVVRATPAGEPEYPAFTIEMISPGSQTDLTDKLDFYREIGGEPTLNTVDDILYYTFNTPYASEDGSDSIKEQVIVFAQKGKVYAVKSTYDANDPRSLKVVEEISQQLTIY